MHKRLWLTLSFIVMGFCLQTVFAQDAPVRSRRAPQLSSDDLPSSTNPSPAPVEDKLPATATPTAGWARHSFADLGLSIEFVGNPPKPVDMQTQTPVNSSFERQVKTQVFHRDGWILSVIRLTSLSRPTLDDLLNFAGGLGDSLGISNPQYLPGQGTEPNFRINGTMKLGTLTCNFRSRFITRGKQVWAVLAQCQQADTPSCAEAAYILDSARITP